MNVGSSLNGQNPALGSDWSCTTDPEPSGQMVSGRLCLAQALVRRYSTTYGTLIDDPDYGYDLADELNDDIGVGDIGRIQSRAQAEALKDQRVIAANITALFTAAVVIMTIVVTDSQGPFSLVLSVSAVTIQILQVK